MTQTIETPIPRYSPTFSRMSFHRSLGDRTSMTISGGTSGYWPGCDPFGIRAKL
jgi:hypothetical protein